MILRWRLIWLPPSRLNQDAAIDLSDPISEPESKLPPLPADPNSTPDNDEPDLHLAEKTRLATHVDIPVQIASDLIVAEPGKVVPSRALNLLVLRSFKKPVGGKVLDTFVNVAGIRSRDTSERFWTRDFLTGNWGGERDRLYKNGIDITLAHFAEVYGVVSGGKHQASAYNGVSVVSFDFYTSGLKLWKGGQIHLTTAWLDGGVSVGREFVGSLNSIQFSDPPRRNYRLFELWYGQKFLDNTLEVRVGKIYPFVKIAASQTSSLFTNASFNFPAFLGTTPGYGISAAYAAAPFGVQILYTPTPQFFFFSNFADGFEDPSGGVDNRYGLKVGLGGKDGVEGVLEVGYRLHQTQGSIGLPGTYRMGYQFHTGEFKDTRFNTNSLPLALGGTAQTRRGNHAFFVMAEQMLFSESSDPKDRRQGLNAFLKATIAPPENVNTIDLNIAGGFAYEGLIPGRDRDVVGIGVSHSRLSKGLRSFYRDLGGNPAEGETVIELTYAAEIAPWWLVVGSLQRIINPGSSNTTPDATVIGLSNRFAF